MRRRSVLLLLICLFLCGCVSPAKQISSGSSPFTEAERAAFETQLLDSLFFSSGGDGNHIPMYFRNDSDYDIANFRIIGEVFTNRALVYYSLIPAHTSVYASVYYSKEERDSGQTYSIRYIIGDYEYQSGGIDLDFDRRNKTGDEDPLSLRLFLQTASGEKPLDPRAPTSFVTGTEIEGLKAGRIYSISPELFSYEKHILNMTLRIGGMLPPEGTPLIVKLVDENGDIRNIASVRNNSLDVIEFFLGGNLEPGKYYLCFEELS